MIQQVTSLGWEYAVVGTVQAARARGSDVLIIDSAGRQHVNTDLMQQLAKVSRVLHRMDPDAMGVDA